MEDSSNAQPLLSVAGGSERGSDAPDKEPEDYTFSGLRRVIIGAAWPQACVVGARTAIVRNNRRPAALSLLPATPILF